MARIARAEVFDPLDIAVLHVINRCVRRCFLMGYDPVSRKNFDHRKKWLEEQLQRFAACFGIDLLGFAILSNHFHLVLRSRPDVVSAWSDSEVARRWLMLCPLRKQPDGSAEEPTEFELNSIRNDLERLTVIRCRLSDISWWMRLLCQPLAMRANREDNEPGRFWQGRFRAIRICDEAALLACAAYVDLNAIRAKLAETIETSNFTSIQRRIESIPIARQSSTVESSKRRPDRFLAPILIDELRDSLNQNVSATPYRASDKGFLSMSDIEYMQLLDWTAREVVTGKTGSTPANLPTVLDRLGIEFDDWSTMVKDFGRLFYLVAGKPKTLAQQRGRLSRRPFHASRRLKRMFVSDGHSAA